MVEATVGGTAVGASGVVADAQAESITLMSINTETSNLRVFIFSPLVKNMKSIVVLISVRIFA